MNRPVIKLARIIALAALAAAGGYFALVYGNWPAKVHGWLLGAGAFLFALTEVYFRNLITDINTIYRKSVFSVSQLERIQQTFPPLRKRVWHLWGLSLLLKVCVGVLAVLLQWDGVPPLWRDRSIFSGYALLIITVFLTLWSARNVNRLEKMADALSAQELKLKEQKRLASELTAGEPMQLKKDKVLLSYTGPAREV